MSEWTDALKDNSLAVRELRQALAALNTGAGNQRSNQGAQTVNFGAQPQAPATPGGLSGAQQVQALNSALGQTAQSASKAQQSLIGMHNEIRQGMRAAMPAINLLISGYEAIQQGIDSTVDAAQRWDIAQDGALARQAEAYESAGRAVDDLNVRLEAAVGETTMERRTQAALRLAAALKDPAAAAAANQIGGALAAAADTGSAANEIETLTLNLIKLAQAGNLNPATGIGAYADYVRGRLGLLPPVLEDTTVHFDALQQALHAQDGAWERVRAGTASYSETVIGLRQELDSLHESEAERLADFDKRIAKLTDENTLIERQHSLESATNNARKAEDRLNKDQAMAIDVYSAAGRAAGSALAGDIAAVNDANASLQDLKDRYKRQDAIDALRTDRATTQESFATREKSITDTAAEVPVLKAANLNDATIEAYVNSAAHAAGIERPGVRPDNVGASYAPTAPRPVYGPPDPNVSSSSFRQTIPGTSFTDRGVNVLGGQRLPGSNVYVHLTIDPVTVQGLSASGAKEVLTQVVFDPRTVATLMQHMQDHLGGN
jgi:hypothetical protein